MTIWIDAQISPSIAFWIQENFEIEAFALRDIGLRDAEDKEIFDKAREVGAVVMTKDSDFVSLLDRFGSPPKIIWITCGNTSNASLKLVLDKTLTQAMDLLNGGENIVEIS